MAVLPNPDRLAVRGEWGVDLSQRRVAFNLSKPDLDAAIAAVDDWIEANAASFNAALPVAARTGLSAALKTELFYRVARKRFGG